MSTILVIDDDPIMGELVQSALEQAGYDVTTVLSGAAGLDLCDALVPDLIVLDSVMPGMSGGQVLTKLRCNGKTRNIPVIILTALPDSDNMVAAFGIGADDYVTKPFNPAELIARIHSILSRTRGTLSPTMHQRPSPPDRLHQAVVG